MADREKRQKGQIGDKEDPRAERRASPVKRDIKAPLENGAGSANVSSVLKHVFLLPSSFSHVQKRNKETLEQP